MSRIVISNEYKALKQDLQRYKMQKRIKMIFKILFCTAMFAVILATAISLLTMDTYGSEETREPLKIVVSEGDSLWNIASDYSGNKDIRKVVYDIKKYNNLENADIRTGMILLIPSEYISE